MLITGTRYHEPRTLDLGGTTADAAGVVAVEWRVDGCTLAACTQWNPAVLEQSDGSPVDAATGIGDKWPLDRLVDAG